MASLTFNDNLVYYRLVSYASISLYTKLVFNGNLPFTQISYLTTVLHFTPVSYSTTVLYLTFLLTVIPTNRQIIPYQPKKRINKSPNFVTEVQQDKNQTAWSTEVKW